MIVLLRGPDGFNAPQDFALAIPDLAWLAPGAAPKLVMFLAAFNPFSIWSLVLLGAGTASTARVSGRRLRTSRQRPLLRSYLSRGRCDGRALAAAAALAWLAVAAPARAELAPLTLESSRHPLRYASRTIRRCSRSARTCANLESAFVKQRATE